MIRFWWFDRARKPNRPFSSRRLVSERRIKTTPAEAPSVPMLSVFLAGPVGLQVPIGWLAG
ncbi:MAG: hypothetical protein V3T29_07310 [Alphaproteobacteria bacterium]